MGNVTKIRLAPVRAPRLPPVVEVNHTEVMLGAALLGLVMAFVVGVVVWACMR